MEKDFNLEKIGKRMPYQTPDGFFDDLEAGIMDKLRGEAGHTAEGKPTAPRDRSKGMKRRTVRMRVLCGVAAVAASVALLVVVSPFAKERQTVPRQTADELAQVEKAFSALSDDDQAYLLQVYQEDVFIGE